MKTIDIKLNVPNYENPFQNLNSLTTIEKQISNDLKTKGFSVFNFPEKNFETLANSIQEKLHDYFKKDLPGQRIQDAIHINEVKKIASNPKIISILSKVYGRLAFPFQTLNFPAGTEQRAHSDHVHFNSIPYRFMAGVWVAFEDVDENNGPLFYYPGSHLWPALSNTEIDYQLKDDKVFPFYHYYEDVWDKYADFFKVKKEYFYAKKGQCLIWASNLVHGSGVVKNKKSTRWSQVTHYYFKDCSYYTPLYSSYREGYYWRKIFDLRNGKQVQNLLNDEILNQKSKYFNFSTFDPEKYLFFNPDVKAAGANPYEHFLLFGIKEGRKF